MVKVCDAIMGSGKTESTIAFMNEHPDQKFIYISPYLEEAKRIKCGCPGLKFVEPSAASEEGGHTKKGHTALLIKKGRNIATTHQAFISYSEEMLQDIKDYGYTLFIDENLGMLNQLEISSADISMAIDSGYLSDNGYRLERTDKVYNGTLFNELFAEIGNREITRVVSKEGEWFFYWTFSPKLITSFKEVIILTYLFEGQGLHKFMEMNGIEYKHIGINTDGNGHFWFVDGPGYVPDYTKHIKEKIHILDHKKLNSIGDTRCALSMNWYKSKTTESKQLKRNMGNLYNQIWKDSSAGTRMWGSFKNQETKLGGNGFSRAFVPFNSKSTNVYSDRKYLSYLVNVFLNPNEKIFYQMNGVDVSDDNYALAILVQWIWRSAIRCGEEIYLYIPSKRMRTLLTDWMEKLSTGGNYIE